MNRETLPRSLHRHRRHSPSPRGSSLCLWTALVALTALGASGCGDDGPYAPSAVYPLDAEESALVYDVNRLREEAGAAALTPCKALDGSASAHSDSMRDEAYLAEQGSDGSGPRSRACAAGYAPACDMSATIAEVVATGAARGSFAISQWTGDATTKALLVNPVFTHVGVGRALGAPQVLWTLDLGSKDAESCR